MGSLSKYNVIETSQNEICKLLWCISHDCIYNVLLLLLRIRSACMNDPRCLAEKPIKALKLSRFIIRQFTGISVSQYYTLMIQGHLLWYPGEVMTHLPNLSAWSNCTFTMINSNIPAYSWMLNFVRWYLKRCLSNGVSSLWNPLWLRDIWRNGLISGNVWTCKMR